MTFSPFLKKKKKINSVEVIILMNQSTVIVMSSRICAAVNRLDSSNCRQSKPRNFFSFS